MYKIDSVPPNDISIYVGLKCRSTGWIYTIDDVHRICKEYVDRVGQCVTVAPTSFIYTNGGEPGAVIGFINYPRFPTKQAELRNEAIELASTLMYELNQMRVSISLKDETLMLSNDKLLDLKNSL